MMLMDVALFVFCLSVQASNHVNGGEAAAGHHRQVSILPQSTCTHNGHMLRGAEDAVPAHYEMLCIGFVR